jgi:hypothetical protein
MRWLAQRCKRLHRHPEGGQSVAQIDGAAAGMDGRNHNLPQTAVPGGGSHQTAKRGDVWNREKRIQTLAFRDNGDHLIHEAVEPNHDTRERRGTFVQMSRDL